MLSITVKCGRQEQPHSVTMFISYHPFTYVAFAWSQTNKQQQQQQQLCLNAKSPLLIFIQLQEPLKAVRILNLIPGFPPRDIGKMR